MKVIIYWDVIFFLNIIVNMYVFYIVSMIMKKRMIVRKMLLGAIVGAGMLLFIFFYPEWLFGIKGIFTYIGISLGSVFIAFGINNIIKTWILSTTVMILLGGGMSVLRYRWNCDVLDIGMWFCLYCICGIAIRLLIFSIGNDVQNSTFLYRVKIIHCKRQKEGIFFLDTGNMLYDPLFQKPVVLINETFANQILREEEQLVLEMYKKNGIICYPQDEINQLTKACFHEIRFQSVGKGSGKLICFLAEALVIEETNQVLKQQPVAVVFEPIFDGKIYQGLLQESLL